LRRGGIQNKKAMRENAWLKEINSSLPTAALPASGLRGQLEITQALSAIGSPALSYAKVISDQ
jgi:hypothetical protein